MTRQQLTITVLDIDEGDGIMHYRLWLNNTITSTSINFYSYNDLFKSFGEGLINFPKTANDSITMEIGENNSQWSFWIFLKVYCEPSGKTHIHIKIDNKSEYPETNKCEFFLKTVPASINKFGEILMSWNPKVQDEINWIPE